MDETAKATFKETGYYTTKLKTSSGKIYEKVNIVGINLEACYNFNYYLMKSMHDPADHLVWLNNTLRDIENKNEVAIVIGHIPPGSDSCLNQWALRFKAITDRFQHLIRFSIFGHRHTEQYSTTRSVEKDKAVGIQYGTGSICPNSGNNPTFRIYDVDEETMLPIRVHSYIFTLYGFD